jgi:DNA modification methylase
MNQWPADKVERRKVADLIPYARNSRTHSDEQVGQIAASIKEWGWTVPVLIDPDGGLIAGHGRIFAAQKLGIEDVPCMVAEGWTDAQKKAYVIADNKLTLNAGWDDEILKGELGELGEFDFDLSLIGFDADELSALMMDEPLPNEGDNQGSTASLADKFGIAPFSVLNAREGWWQNRKRAWVGLGIESENGRDIKPTSVPANLPEGHYLAGKGNNEGGSIFDPTLCELAYSWFSPKAGLVLDPFAGGSVRGVVASRLGRQYVGVELREEQVDANRLQGDALCADLPPVWHTGDSRNIDRICAGVEADFVFSCPPYADLEVYSDDPDDLSTLKYEDFKPAYFEIIAKACSLLKDNRFACFVVGDVRDKKGNYYNFVGDTVEAFKAAGLHFYNEAILVTSVGSLPIRVGRQFATGRKLGKTHQNVLVFVKGDGKKATQACGEVEVHIPEPETEHSDLGEEL